MALGLLGRKIGMTQRFNEEGHAVPVTVIEMPPCPIIQKKTIKTDGYNALQIGFGERKKNRTTRPMSGHFKKSGIPPTRILREVRIGEEEIGKYEVGGTIPVTHFEKGDFIDVFADSKGRGFAGVIKRHNFHGKSATHGTHENFRHGGAIGQCAWPGRVFKGMKMPGQMGNKRVAIQNLRVVDVLEEQSLLYVRGAIPGARNGIVLVQKATKKSAQKAD